MGDGRREGGREEKGGRKRRAKESEIGSEKWAQ